MNPLPTRATDSARNSAAQPIIVSDSMPQIIKQRMTQALRVNSSDDWRQFAQLCGATALRFFAESGYDPYNADFKACCRLARVAYLRGVACMAQGFAVPMRRAANWSLT